MRKLFLLSVFVFTFVAANSLHAQSYQNAIGIRVGLANGITFKHSLGSTNKLEILATNYWDGFWITGLFEYQQPIPSMAGVEWYVGGGVHIGQYNRNSKYYSEGYTAIGLDAILGAEYKFPSAPFVLGLDWKPIILFGDRYANRWRGDQIAVSFRYTIN